MSIPAETVRRTISRLQSYPLRCRIRQLRIVLPCCPCWHISWAVNIAIPLNQQEKQFKRFGINLNRQTVANWVIKTSSSSLTPLYVDIHREIITKQIIHETVLEVLCKPGGEPSTNAICGSTGQAGRIHQSYFMNTLRTFRRLCEKVPENVRNIVIDMSLLFREVTFACFSGRGTLLQRQRTTCSRGRIERGVLLFHEAQ